MKAPKFITVTTHDGTEALINIDAIAAICQQPGGSTRIFVSDGPTIDVTESLKNINDRIKRFQPGIKLKSHDFLLGKSEMKWSE